MEMMGYSLILLTIAVELAYRINKAKTEIKAYRFNVKNNTIFYYLLIFTAILISSYLFPHWSLWAFFLIFLILFVLHEIQWYAFHTGLLKDESESTKDFYAWCNHLNDGITNVSAIVEDGYDFSEGIFNDDFTISNRQAMQNKYDLYYQLLNLQPGMKVLDIGCGNGHWAYYLQQRGINVTGIVLAEDNYAECRKKNIKTLLGDARIILANMNEKFDAISAIGPIEHFSSVSQPPKSRIKTLEQYYQNVERLIDTNSQSRRYLNSIMTTNLNFSKYRTLEFYFHIYLIASVFGTGYYPSDDEMEKIYNTTRSKIIAKRDYTEDYRFIFVRNKDSLGNFRWRFNTPKRLLFLAKAILTDPYWLHRIIYGYTGSWLWQFGGSHQNPTPENKDTPVRAYIYVTEVQKPN